ncbi:MAG: hydantoinase/oxoprolinase family protein [Clostridia bacterium]|nr:hydantoinase/oxoprolinase family protein [Clostridia bacterium]
MAYGIGIDTGGTYTDAVVYDFDTGRVLAKGKSPTTHHNLTLGIGGALDMLPRDLLEKAGVVSLSTTLATNACVENKGGRARLVLVGTEQRTLERVGADKKYGLNYDDVLCVETKTSFDGKVAEQPDWKSVLSENRRFFGEAEALCVAGLNSLRNGGANEKAARDAITAEYDVPFIMACELATELNIMERGATALLNARLLPVIRDFMAAVTEAMRERGLTAQQMIVRSDGGLMTDEFARTRPVETILSGPAASVMGCRALADCGDCLVVDMGGTTTDVSVVRGGVPDMSGGISIGGWRTQIKGVYIDTFGLGGDTRVYMQEGRLRLDTRRVEPICAAAAKWPKIKTDLAELLERVRMHTRQLHEFLYLMRMPTNLEKYTEGERKLIMQLADGPQMIGGGVLDYYGRNSERLEKEGIVMRCGLTPTDIMHIRGDYNVFDADASRLAARCFLRSLIGYTDGDEDLNRLCDDIYTMVKRRLFENIARVFITSAYSKACNKGIGDQLNGIIAHMWENRDAAPGFFQLKPSTNAALIGTGAPTHIFLPDVAKALGVMCIIPENSEVANAVGAVVADVSARAVVNIRQEYTYEGNPCWILTAPGMRLQQPKYESAIAEATRIAEQMAGEEARRRGAMGELTVTSEVARHRGTDRDGASIDLGTDVIARATGRIGI